MTRTSLTITIGTGHVQKELETIFDALKTMLEMTRTMVEGELTLSLNGTLQPLPEKTDEQEQAAE